MLYSALADVPADAYDAVMLCVPNDEKLALIRDCLAHDKHVLVEKPLIGTSVELKAIEELAQQRRLVVYTAYNHRFEPALIAAREALALDRISDKAQPPYLARMIYGNGTAALVKESPWRDSGGGVVHEIGSHLVDLADFLFPGTDWGWFGAKAWNYENVAPDYATIAAGHALPNLDLTVSYLSWKNEFKLDIFGHRGSIHVDGLCKWGPSTFTVRNRALPAGVPFERSTTFVQPDPTWAFEYEHFKRLIDDIIVVPTSLEKDRWINGVLS